MCVQTSSFSRMRGFAGKGGKLRNKMRRSSGGIHTYAYNALYCAHEISSPCPPCPIFVRCDAMQVCAYGVRRRTKLLPDPILRRTSAAQLGFALPTRLTDLPGDHPCIDPSIHPLHPFLRRQHTPHSPFSDVLLLLNNKVGRQVGRDFSRFAYHTTAGPQPELTL